MAVVRKSGRGWQVLIRKKNYMSAQELGKKYQGFYTDSRTKMIEALKPIDKADPYYRDPHQGYLHNMTKAGEKDVVKDEMERLYKEKVDDHEEY